MESLTAEYIQRAEWWLLITTLFYFLMNGAGIFETAVLIPKWSTSPPESFQMLKGKYGLDLKTFWIVMHSVHELTFIVAIIVCWELESIRNGLLILFALHFLVRAWTLMYFAPNIIDFQKIANANGDAPDLLKRTTRWRNLNYLRTGLFIAISICLVPLCMKAFQL
jgi:hypothetical protein